MDKKYTAAELGSRGGKKVWSKNRAKMLKIVRANGKKGGRPKTILSN